MIGRSSLRSGATAAKPPERSGAKRFFGGCPGILEVGIAEKLKLALYWAATCGGCDVAVLDLNEKILDLAAAADIYLWPIAMDFRYKEAEAWLDNFIDVCLYNGSVRSSEGEYLAQLLRRKSKVLVAFGSCAAFGGIPGLANVGNARQVMDRVYRDTVSTENSNGTRPCVRTTVAEGDLTLPEVYDSVRSLGQTVDVDYLVPGCPPVPERIWEVIGAIVSGRLPAKGSTIGVTDTTVCEECKRVKKEKMIGGIVRPHLIEADLEHCLLEQRIICMGPATRGGCGARCLDAAMPCRGCYGPAPHVTDQGAKMLSAIASIMTATDEAGANHELDGLVDALGTFYRFSMPVSLLTRARMPTHQ